MVIKRPQLHLKYEKVYLGGPFSGASRSYYIHYSMRAIKMPTAVKYVL